MAMDLPKDPVSLFQLFCPVSLVEEWVGWTNSYVALLLTKELPPKPLASWQQTTVAEVYIWLAILIYIGIHNEKRVSDYWITPKPGELKLVHPVTKWMTYPRFQQLFQFLRVSPPSESNTTSSVERTISQVSRWSEHIQAVSSDLFVPGKHIAIDKCVIRFKAGSRKPGPKGIKAWVVAQEGYFVRWKFHIPDSRPRKQGILVRTQTNKHRLAKTQAAVLDLILQLPITSYRVFFDDLFTTPQLLRALRDHGVVSTGGARLNGDIDPPFALVKSQDSRGQVQWKFDGPRADNQANPAAWKDNALVLFLNSFLDGSNTRETQRRRSSSTKARAQQAPEPSGTASEMVMQMPSIAVCYNERMNAVDRGDQLRFHLGYKHSVHHDSGQAIAWTFIFDTVLVNTYILQQKKKYNWKSYNEQTSWREAIAVGLIKQFNSDGATRRRFSTGDEFTPFAEHHHVKSTKYSSCVGCQRRQVGVIATRNSARAPPGEVYQSSSKTRARQTNYRCDKCNVALCTQQDCWYFYHLPICT